MSHDSKLAGLKRNGAGAALLVAALGVLLLGAPERAAADPAPYIVTMVDEVFVPVSEGATTIPASGHDGVVALTLPFTFRFFGNDYTTMRVSTNALATFGTDNPQAWANAVIPTAASPNDIIAVWWDDLQCPLNTMKELVVGTAPSRRYIVEWNGCYRISSANTIQAQLTLTEGSTNIKLNFGAIAGTTTSHNATVGIENATGTVGYYGLPQCTNQCGSSHFPTNKAIHFRQGPDVLVTRVTGAPVGYAGVAMHVEAEIANGGGALAQGIGARFWVSRNPTFDAQARELGTASNSPDLAPGVSATYALDPLLPVDLTVGDYYILAEADPANNTIEDNENNNFGAYGPFRVGSPAPDLAVPRLVVPARVAPDETFTLDWDAQNLGNLAAADIGFIVVISTNDLISGSDRQVGVGTVSLDALETKTLATPIEVPSDIRPGRYTIGVMVDPQNELRELNELNNVAAGTPPTVIATGALEVATAALPPTQVGAPYCGLLEAVGGDGTYVWNLAVGSTALPPGLTLTEEPLGAREQGNPYETLLCGTPSSEGEYTFSLAVSSDSLTDEAPITLSVARNGAPLTITSQQLPAAGFQLPYEAALSAVGGRPPYAWRISAGNAPVGIVLDEDGLLHGLAVEDGNFEFVLEVKDSAGDIGTQGVAMVVSSPSRITCVSRALGTYEVGQELSSELKAAGGKRPYKWNTVETRRLANGAGDFGESFDAAPPPGMVLAESGELAGTPTAAGRYLWIVQVADAGGTNKDTCTLSLEITYRQGISIITTALPAATVERPYEAQLQATGSDGFVTWTLVEGSSLPEGLGLSAGGTLEGTLPASLLDGESSRSFNFLVRARDAQNRTSVAALSIEVLQAERRPIETTTPAGAEDEGGCQSASGGTSLALLAAGLLLATLRRRHS